ncbi:hypothetical protein BDZ97DRAFT_1767102 [Flammula alnicola]|nr:hypothetical protein BDZ97DRAFT_1767102 [Flammula alnicola]
MDRELNIDDATGSGGVRPLPQCPSSLAKPLNAYAHLGMPKPFVHVFDPPLNLALDSHIVSGQGRFVRRVCRPNAVLRPALRQTSSGGRNLSFGVFARRDLKASEEIVLGWGWDDGNTHR